MDINLILYFGLLFGFTKFILHDIVYNVYLNRNAIFHLLKEVDISGLPDPDLYKENQHEEQIPMKKKEVKYEEKYLDKVRSSFQDYIFSNDEQIQFSTLLPSFEIKLEKERLQRISEIQKELQDFEDMIEPVNNDILDKLEKELHDLSKTPFSTEDIEEATRDHIISLRLDNLKNSHVMEMTPLGNVVLSYNKEKDAFDYFSDSTIPYRYLEVVCRKFVLTYQCIPLYVDMEMELQKEKERQVKEKEEKLKELELKKEMEKQNLQTQPQQPVKKNVFAKLKSYNKSTGHVITAAPPKNSIPSNKTNSNNNNNNNNGEHVLLKAKANVYSYQGRFSNFQAIKKVDRKLVNKKLQLTFADFKKMQQKQEKK